MKYDNYISIVLTDTRNSQNSQAHTFENTCIILTLLMNIISHQTLFI